MHLIWANRFFQKRLRTGIRLAAEVLFLYEHPAIGPFKFNAERIPFAVGKIHCHAVVKLKVHIPAGRAVTQSIARKFSNAFDLYGAGQVGAVAPGGNVNRMNTAACHKPKRIIADVEPVAVIHAVSRVQRPRRRSQPQLVIQPVRDRHRWIVFRSHAVARGNSDFVNLADSTAAHHLAGKTGISARTFLGAELKHPAVSINLSAEHLSLLDAHPQGLFAIYVLSRPHRRQCVQHVPVVRRSNHNCVYVVAGNKLAKITVRAAAGGLVLLVHCLLCPVAILPFDIAEGHHLRIGQMQEITQQRGTSAAHADKAHHYPLAGSDSAGLT